MRVPCPGVNGHARGFVDADDVVVLIKNVQRNGFRLGLKRRAWLRIDLDLIAGAKFLGILGGLAIEKDKALRDQFLNASAGEFGAMGGYDAIEAKADVGFGDGELDGLEIGHVESVSRKRNPRAQSGVTVPRDTERRD